jgi:predicted MPP superfamily phosphohydrolase
LRSGAGGEDGLPFGLAAAAALGGVLAGGLFRYAHDVEPGRVEGVRVELELPRLDGAFDGYRISQLSDLHASAWMTRERAARAVRLANAFGPDLTVLTGDFATYSPLADLLSGSGSRELRHLANLAAPLRELRAPDGVFAVLGNHDHKTDAAEVRRLLEEAGVVELDNAVRTVRRGGASLHVCGVDSAREGEPGLRAVLRGLPEDGAAVLLAHEPDFVDRSAATGRFDLQLSGHSHGGQVGVFPLDVIAAPRLGTRYLRGLYEVGDTKLYVNRGLGAHPRLRFLCRPEVTALTLRAPGGLL